jgi:preflagellin peptidase FlaK
MVEYRIIVCIVMLIGASYLDLKNREVNEKYWVFFSLIGLFLYVFEYIFGVLSIDLYLSGAVIGVTSISAFALWYFGFYGGADYFALVSLSIILPIYYAPFSIHPFTPAIVLTNSTVLVLILPIFFLSKNLFRIFKGEDIFSGFEHETRLKKLVVIFIGYKMKNVKKTNFYFPIEKSVDGKRFFDVGLLRNENDEELFLQGRDVWGSPGIPLLFFMNVGFFAMILIGDFVSIFLNNLFLSLI